VPSAIYGRGETIFPARRSGPETKADYEALPIVRLIRVRQMIEAITAILGLFSAGVFIAHAIDAYRAA
jgi:hypothetical protein